MQAVAQQLAGTQQVPPISSCTVLPDAVCSVLCCFTLQEVVQPPSCCPPDVLRLLSDAQAAQQARELGGALNLLELAESAWREYLQQHSHGGGWLLAVICAACTALLAAGPMAQHS